MSHSPSHISIPTSIRPETIHVEPLSDNVEELLQDSPDTSSIRMKQRYVLGVILLLCVVCLWVASSTLIQSIFVNMNFNSPFFLTYYSTSLFTLYLGVYAIQQLWRYHVADRRYQSSHSFVSLSGDHQQSVREMTQLAPSTHRLDEWESQDINISIPTEQNIIWDTARLSLFLCPIWFLMNYLFNLSLDMTSVASNTILSTLSGFFVMMFTWMIFGTRPEITNIVGVGLTITGAVFISLRDDSSNNNGDKDEPNASIAGDLVAASSAIFYGLYTVMLRVKIPDDTKVNMVLVFGFIGLFNFLLFWPFFFILNAMSWERFQWPQPRVLLFLTINGFFGTVVSDFLWAKSVLLTSPLIATLGLSLTIPIAMITDFILHHTTFSVMYVMGSILVLCGFILVNYRYKHDIQQQQQQQHDGDIQRESSISSNTRISMDEHG